MKKEVFFTELAEQLEIDEIKFSENTILTDLDSFDSMAVMSIIAFVDDNFNMQLSAQQLKSITTIESLMRLIGVEKFG